MDDKKPSLLAMHARVGSREDLARFVDALRQDLTDNSSQWENAELGRFLEAMSGWMGDMHGYYRNRGEEFNEEAVPWKVFADILHASKIYE